MLPAAVGAQTTPPQTPAPQPMTDPLMKVGHIVVIFEENRSFDGMFGLFPKANGLANAGDTAVQLDPDGKPYKVLPQP
jgi:phospholipase C